jgi:hypothetical protein
MMAVLAGSTLSGLGRQGNRIILHFGKHFTSLEMDGAALRELLIFTGPAGLKSRTIDSFDSGG